MISVCMATYNGEKYIKKQLDSILNQLSLDDEIIISDDGSTDDTLKIIESYNDSRIKIFHHLKDESLAKIKYAKSFYYATSNFENAIKNTSGDYIFLSDQDDIWIEGKKQKMLEALKNSDCVMCNYSIIDEDDNITVTQYLKKQPYNNSYLHNLFFVPFLGCCMAFKKHALCYIFPFPKNIIAHDLWIGSLCVAKKNLVWLEESLHLYRRHSGNVSPTTTNKRNPFLFMISYRFKFTIQFIKRVIVNNV